MPPAGPFDRDIGRHDAQIEALIQEVHQLRVDVSNIKQTLDESKGSWKVLLGIAGLSGALGAGATKISHILGITT